IDRLKASGQIKEHDGALWFGGDEEDEEEEGRVVVRSNGEPTYFASDIGYLLSRFERRDFNRVVEVWGADHHGYVPRMKAAAAARQLAYWPEVVEDATRLMEPHRIPYYVHDLATAVHRFYHAGNEEGEHRVVVDDPQLTRARLELCRAARHTLMTALDLIGVS